MSWEGLVIRYAGEPILEMDPTGAGDAFDGVLLAALVAGTSPGDALRPRATRALAWPGASRRGPSGEACDRPVPPLRGDR